MTPIGQASMHRPQFGQEYTCAFARPFLAFVILIPAFLRGISRISVGICIYLVKGRTQKKTPSAREYAHQVGSIFTWFPRNAVNTWLRDFVRNDPPLMSAVNPSASRRRGNIAHNEYRPTRSRKLGFVVLLIPKNLDLILFIIARKIPLSTTSRKKSIRKKSREPLRVVSVSATKYLKKIG